MRFDIAKAICSCIEVSLRSNVNFLCKFNHYYNKCLVYQKKTLFSYAGKKNSSILRGNIFNHIIGFSLLSKLKSLYVFF